MMSENISQLSLPSSPIVADFADVTWTSMASEVGCWAVLYTVFIVNMLVPYVRKNLSSKPFWDAMTKRPGQALTTTAEESVLCMSISAHHLFGGVLMLYGQLTANPVMWLHGLFVELGFEIVDVFALLLNQWPYTVVQPGLKLITLFHHFPGLCAAPSLVMIGLHKNEDLQAIGWSLLLAGGVSLLSDSFKQTRNLDTQMGQWLILHLINMTGVILARFVVFPIASYGLLKTCWESSPDYISYLTTAGIGSMAVFNFVVLVLMTEKLIRNGSIYLFGRTKIATRAKEL